MKLSQKDVVMFQRAMWTHYRNHRRKLPWRKTRDPWKILVSEVMLQQTQVRRVIPFYKKFVREFPTPRRLAAAPLKKVLALWSGLGYNRRALYLKRAAEIIVREYGGGIPRDLQKLDALPGIGANTAAAILAYVWNERVVFVETNIRSVFLHHFFSRRRRVRDAEILKLVERTLPPNTRDWYAALMDYGVHLKQTLGNQNQRSAHYMKQKPFRNSRRQLRGEVLRRALAGTLRAREFSSDILSILKKEGFPLV